MGCYTLLLPNWAALAILSSYMLLLALLVTVLQRAGLKVKV